MALPLLSHLFESGEKEKLIVLAEQALAAKESTWQDKYFDLNNYYDKDDLVAKVRRILAKVYVNPEERDKRIDNYEKLFLVSHKIEDYDQLRKEYKSKEEKEQFWRKMEKRFGEYHVKNAFEVYKMERER